MFPYILCSHALVFTSESAQTFLFFLLFLFFFNRGRGGKIKNTWTKNKISSKPAGFIVIFLYILTKEFVHSRALMRRVSLKTRPPKKETKKVSWGLWNGTKLYWLLYCASGTHIPRVPHKHRGAKIKSEMLEGFVLLRRSIFFSWPLTTLSSSLPITAPTAAWENGKRTACSRPHTPTWLCRAASWLTWDMFKLLFLLFIYIYTNDYSYQE